MARQHGTMARVHGTTLCDRAAWPESMGLPLLTGQCNLVASVKAEDGHSLLHFMQIRSDPQAADKLPMQPLVE